MSYVESTGGVCICYDDTKTRCVVNDDCGTVDTSGLTTTKVNAAPATTKLDSATDALCESYSIVVDNCEDVSFDDIAENGCMAYVENTGGICVCFDDSKTKCVVNDDCDLVETSTIS